MLAYVFARADAMSDAGVDACARAGGAGADACAHARADACADGPGPAGVLCCAAAWPGRPARARAGPLAGEVRLRRQSLHQAWPLWIAKPPRRRPGELGNPGHPATRPTRARTREQKHARTAQLVRAPALPALRWDR